MKRILLITDYFYPHWTGIAKAMLNMVKVLRGEYEFTVLTVRYRDDLPTEEVVEGARVIRVPYLLKLSRSCIAPAILPHIAREARKHDAVMVNSPCTVILPAAAIALLRKRKLAVFHQGDLNLPEGAANRVIEKVFDVSTHAAMKTAARVSTYTRDYAEHSRVLGRYLDKFTPLLMPMLLEPPAAELTPELARLVEWREQGKVLFGFAGRFVEEKGFDVLFRAIPRILEEVPQAQFVFAGETNMVYEDFYGKNRHLLDPISDKVFSVGLLDPPQLRRFYELIDFVVMPSRSDCFPLVQAEACLSGRPSIASDIPGLRVVVRETGFGFLARKEDPADLAEKVIRAVRERSTLEARYPQAAALLSPEKSTADLRAFFAELTA